MAFKVPKSVHKALEPIRGQTLVLRSREQLARKLCGSCNGSGGGLELWLKIVGLLEAKEILIIEDIAEENGRKVTLIQASVNDEGLRLNRDELRTLNRALNGLRKRHVDVDKPLGYVYRPRTVAA